MNIETLMQDDVIPCTLKRLTGPADVAAAQKAVIINPVNRPATERLAALVPGFSPTPEHLAVDTSRWWGAKGVKLSVKMMEGTPLDLQKRILAHMNAWNRWANIEFYLSATDPQVRIAFGPSGYWSYMGTDILSIPKNQPTMNLQGFTMQTSEAEFVRVVRHETGHTLGCPHEHMRRAIVERLDVAKTEAYFLRTQGWSAQEVRQQVLTPFEERQIMQVEGLVTDDTSIMCYQLPAEITKDGRGIPGGGDINANDGKYMSVICPKLGGPVDPINPNPTCPSAAFVLQAVKAYNAARHMAANQGANTVDLTPQEQQAISTLHGIVSNICGQLTPVIPGLPLVKICQELLAVCPAGAGGQRQLDAGKLCEFATGLLCPQRTPGAFAAEVTTG